TAYALGSAFSHIPDKQQAWDDLHRLTEDSDNGVRWGTAYALGSAFSHIPDKQQAWDDLHRLTEDSDNGVRWRAAEALGNEYSHIPNDYKQQAWNDLYRLTQDKDYFARRCAAEALGNAYSHIPNKYKQQTLDDLLWLTQDEDSDVRALAYLSIGKIFIFRAVDAENEEYFKKEMEEAIRYFEKSSQQGTYSNPAKFCLPFYRSVYTITFKKNEADIHKYIAEAKSAVEGSESKEKLFEAVENLSNALGEMQKVKNFNEMKSELKAYLKYCERAAELLSSAEEKTPGAASILRKGLPIIDARIKGIIEEIQEKAKMVCKQTKGTGTPYEPLGCEVNQWAKKMMSEKDYFKSEKNVSRIIHTLGEFCKLLPPDKRVYTCDLIEEINGEEELGDKLSKIVLALTYLQPNLEIELCKNIVKTPESGEKTDEVASIKQKHIDDTALD
ncbi:MAG: HEAT repeat domain-containing protein, partial [Methanococcoides sp.]|nr:HEAT repeat domain-containing protein [Methanococcoides sp.]